MQGGQRDSSRAALTSVAVLVLTCTGVSANDRGEFVPPDTILHTHYDAVSPHQGVANADLLTGGLGRSGLMAGAPPVSNPPTTEELRRLAIYNNYRALVDPTSAGGFGVLYGPNVSADGVAGTGEGRIPGDEYIAFTTDRRSRRNITMMVQVPDSFDPARACIVTAPSSGSRGIYGAIATAGEWGLKNGCAVAYTDKGTGTGAHDLQNNLVYLMQGQAVDLGAAGDKATFTAKLTDAERAAFNAATPNRFAFKHAHSQQNPEKDWGRDVLDSIRFAFHVLDRKFSGRTEISRRNTIVIASSVSNGGGASVRAAEQDDDRLIDAVVVGEPNVTPVYDAGFAIVQGDRPPLQAHSRPLMDYITLVNVFQGCANAAPANAAAPLNTAASPARCASLKAKGLLSAATLAEQATEAQTIINGSGILPEQNLVQPGYWFANVSQSISVTYANAYGRFSVADHLCGYSMAAASTTTLQPVALNQAAAAVLFAASNGIPPTGGVSLINNSANTEDRASTPDQNLDGALCLRSLATGKDAVTGTALEGAQRAAAQRIREGVEAVRASGDLHGIPAIVVNGRNDGILPPNFTSRAYFGRNQIVEGQRSRLRYYEVTNAHHLDTLNQVAGYAAAYVPLHRYFIQAMDLMYAHLRDRRPLPSSQVVRTRPRGTGAPPITADNVPPIGDAPPSADLITFDAGQVRIPD